MGMINKLLDVFNLSNDEYDDEYDDGYETDEDDYEEKKSTRKRLFSGKPEAENDAEYDEAEKSVKQTKLVSKQKSKVIPMKNSRGLEVCIIRPNTIEDAREITDTLLTGKAVVLNLEGIHVEVAQRIIDFSAGSSYSIGGNLQKITNYIFIITPPNVDVSGDFQELVSGGIDLSSFN